MSFSSGKGWCECAMTRKWSDVDVTHYPPPTAWHQPAPTVRKERRAIWLLPDVVKIYDDPWGESHVISRRDFSVKNHAKERGGWSTGGHNWYMTTRFDVWVWHPTEPFQWHGWLITGGDNCTFRIRRTKTSIFWIARRNSIHTVTDEGDGWFRGDRKYRLDRYKLPLKTPVTMWAKRFADRWFQSDSREGVPAAYFQHCRDRLSGLAKAA